MASENYYTEKRRCYRWIEQVLKQSSDGVSMSYLVYEVKMRWGFGQKNVTDFIKNLTEMGKIEQIDGVLSWKRQKMSGKSSKK